MKHKEWQLDYARQYETMITKELWKVFSRTRRNSV